MALFGLRKQFPKVIEWNDDSADTLVYRFPMTDRYEIMNGSAITVRPSQCAMFVEQGQISDVLYPGNYKLSTENLPILTKLKSWKYAFESPYKGDVYYVNLKQFPNQKWGTANPVMMRDPDFGMIRLRGYGIFSFKINEPVIFMNEISGTKQIYRVSDIYEQIKRSVVSVLSDVIAESGIAAMDLAASYSELAELARLKLTKEYSFMGIEIALFYIENLSLPEEVEKTLDKRTSIGILSDKMGTYTQYQAAEAMRDAARNPGNMSGVGMGLGVGMGVGQLFGDAIKGARDESKPAPVTAVKCPKCKAEVKSTAKFCPECGEKMDASKFCASCGAEIKGAAKFCPECGKNLK